MARRWDEGFSRREERVHALTHGVGVLLAVAALVGMVLLAVRHAGPQQVVAASIFGASLVLLYASSTLYHICADRWKGRLKYADYSAIYVLIAGSYTAFMLGSLGGAWGWSLFGVAWGLAALGIVLEFWLRRRWAWLPMAFYLTMGWLIVLGIGPLLRALGTGPLLLLLAGGACYSGGVVFYTTRRLPWNHAIWHLLVMAGSACHVVAFALDLRARAG